DHIKRFAGLAHVSEARFEQVCHPFAWRETGGSGALGIETGLAVEAVECAYLSIVRSQIDPQRNAEPPRSDRPENSRVKEYGLHIFS
ncbi:hypothetical protein, partial [Bacillus pumilus]|uniref:hypothetical protein n=1 Tax=Bacillus pumilus TaxID=1408 RepID=UPI001C92E960